MAIRTSIADVRSIMEDVADIVDADITKYITTANVLVNDVLGTGTTDILEQIELYLTGHLISITRSRQAKKEEAGGAKIEYTGYWSKGLDSTSYGQMVLALDTTGAFADLGRRPATITAIKSFD
jgi:hypothetical protein